MTYRITSELPGFPTLEITARNIDEACILGKNAFVDLWIQKAGVSRTNFMITKVELVS